ncbi:hypothetical protein J437_LFUL004216 [Ladona fulva]|uniref:Peptidase S1 domain-containing protein n=1 Tax=Ladona fulva TaxID=123851 RepID=A0A8K0NTX8_LADFU|nr:hypothetical protein J437_LFUL004216 [Ladona fulva]
MEMSIKRCLVILLLLPIGILQQRISKPKNGKTTVRMAKINEFPSTVVIFDEGNANCGGVILASEWVLVAGNCFIGAEEMDFNNTRISAGSTYLSSGGSWHYVKEAHRSKKSSPFHGGGVGLIKVTPPFYLKGDYIKEAVLPSEELILKPEDVLTIVGHGGLLEEQIYQSDELRKKESKLVDHEECKEDYEFINISIGDTCFCSQVPAAEENRLCLWGASDVTFKDNAVVGLRVWDHNCGGFPNIHVQVSKYVKWIQKKIGKSQKKKKTANK